MKKTVATLPDSNKHLNTAGITSVSKKESKAQYAFIKAEGLYLNEEYAKALTKFQEVLTFEPNQATTHYKISQCQFRLGNEIEAYNSAKLAVRNNPKNETFSYFLADIYKSRNQLNEVVQTYQNLIDNTGDFKYNFKIIEGYDALILREVYKKSNLVNRTDDISKQQLKGVNNNILAYYQKQLEALQLMEDGIGQNFRISMKRQDIYLKTFQVDNALLETDKMISMDPNNISHKLKKGEVLFNLKSKQEGIEYMEKVVESYPNESLPYLSLANFYKENKEFDKYQDQLSKLISLSGMSLEQKVYVISSLLSSTVEGGGDKTTALQLSKKLVQLYPKAPQSHSLLGDAYLMNEQKIKARDSYYNVLEYDDSKAVVWNQLLDLDGELVQMDSLENHLGMAMNKFPDELKYYVIMSDIHVQNKAYNKAKHVLENGLTFAEHDFDMQYEFYLRLGDVYFNLKEYPNCYSSFEKALEYDPNNPYALNNYSYYISESDGDLDVAKSNCERLLRIEPNDYNYLDTYAWVLYKNMEYEKAYVYIKRAAKGNNGVVLEHAGDIAFKLNKENDALYYWNEAKLTGEASEEIDIKINEKKIP